MVRWFRVLIVLLLVCWLSSALGAPDLRIASWNIARLGHGNQKAYPALARIGAHFDFLAVQEVMTAEGVERLQRELEKHTGERWGLMYSHLVGRGGYREMYAFLWREAAIEYVDGAVVFLDTTDRFAREPYSARFRERASGWEFVAATVHIVYGRSTEDRTPEIHALREYWDWLDEVYPQTPARLLMGDFNLPPDHPAWVELWEVAQPLIVTGASTLSAVDGRYANLYDNIIVPRGYRLPVREVGILRYPPIIGYDHERARRHVSDHAPVYVLLGNARLQERSGGQREAVSRQSCVDLNRADKSELERLIHIGSARAEAIVAGRPWRSVDELTRIRGLGTAQVEAIKRQGLVCP